MALPLRFSLQHVPFVFDARVCSSYQEESRLLRPLDGLILESEGNLSPGPMRSNYSPQLTESFSSRGQFLLTILIRRSKTPEGKPPLLLF